MWKCNLHSFGEIVTRSKICTWSDTQGFLTLKQNGNREGSGQDSSFAEDLETHFNDKTEQSQQKISKKQWNYNVCPTTKQAMQRQSKEWKGMKKGVMDYPQVST